MAMLTDDRQVKFLPINYYARVGRSKIRPIRDTLNFFQLIMRTALYFAPLRVFMPISIFFFSMWKKHPVLFQGNQPLSKRRIVF